MIPEWAPSWRDRAPLRAAYKRVSGPATEPLAVSDVRDHVRQDAFEDDGLIARLIQAAREETEEFCRRAWIQQTWRLSLDAFPGRNGLTYVPWPRPGTAGDGLILLERTPVSAITAFTYVDTQGVTQTLSPADYQLDLEREPARVLPAYGTSWPATRTVVNAVQITFTCGLALASDVPAAAKLAMLQAIAHWYTNRESVLADNRAAAIELPGVAEKLLMAADLRVWRFG